MNRYEFKVGDAVRIIHNRYGELHFSSDALIIKVIKQHKNGNIKIDAEGYEKVQWRSYGDEVCSDKFAQTGYLVLVGSEEEKRLVLRNQLCLLVNAIEEEADNLSNNRRFLGIEHVDKLVECRILLLEVVRSVTKPKETSIP